MYEIYQLIDLYIKETLQPKNRYFRSDLPKLGF